MLGRQSGRQRLARQRPVPVRQTHCDVMLAPAPMRQIAGAQQLARIDELAVGNVDVDAVQDVLLAS
jgi:hypothetical protein